MPSDSDAERVKVRLPLPRASLPTEWSASDAGSNVPAEVSGPIFKMLRHAVGKGWISSTLAARADQILDDTQAYLAASDAAVLGLPGAWERFSSLLKPEASTLLDAFKPFPGNPLDLGGCRVTLRSAFAPIQAVLGQAPQMLGQAITGYVRRAEAVERLSRVAAMGLDTEAERWLRQVVEHAVELGGTTGAGLTVQRLLAREIGERDSLRAPELGSMLARAKLRGAGVPWPGPGPGPGRDPKWPPIGFGTLDVCQIQWMECVDAVSRPLAVPFVVAPEVDRVEPTAFCAGSGGTVTLWPGPGGFPAQPGDDVRLIVTLTGAVVRWSATRIDIDVPAGAPAGCWTIEWELFRGGQMLEDAGPWAPCSKFFFGRAPDFSTAVVTRQEVAHILVAGAPFARLSSAGQDRFVEAPGCTAVPVRWVVGSGLENTACRAKVTFEAQIDTGGGWQPLTLDDTSKAAAGDGWHGGTVMMQSATDSVVRLNVQLLIGGQPCQSAQASFEVRRYEQLTLDAPPLVQEGSFTASVRRSCPAPAGGLAFRIESDAIDAVPAVSATIPAGSTSVAVGMSALRCGTARLTVSAPGHRGDTREVTIRGIPEIRNLRPAAATACSNIRLVVDLRCAGPNPVLQLSGPDGLKTITLSPVGGRAPADPWGETSWTGVAQGLSAGTWTPVAQSVEGRSSVPGSSITVTPQPVTVTATVIATNPVIAPGSNLGAVPMCLGADVVVEVSAVGATEMTATARNTMQVSRRTRTPQCGTWVERFTGPFFRAETFEITATGPGGSQTVTRSLPSMANHPFAVGAVRVINTSTTKVTAVVYVIDPVTLQNVPLVLGEVAGRSAKLFDDFIGKNKIPDCTPIVIWVVLSTSYLPIQTDFRGVVVHTPAPGATLFRTVGGGRVHEMLVDSSAINGTLS